MAAGIAKADIEGRVRSLLAQALEEGRSSEWVKQQFDEVMLRYLDPTSLPRGVQLGDPVQPWHARVIARTNIAQAQQRAQRAMLEDKITEDLFPAFQYSAVLDGRVRATHAALDNRIFKRDNPIWDRIWPPLFFNCRCTVVGVNAEDWDGEESSTRLPGGLELFEECCDDNASR